MASKKTRDHNSDSEAGWVGIGKSGVCTDPV